MNPMNRRRAMQALAGAVLLPAFARTASAKAYPDQPVKVINPFPPGGSSDVIVRAVTAKMSEFLGGSMYIQNLPGAGGTIGSDRAAKSPPDGYTLLLSNNASQAIAPSLYARLPYDPIKDFDHIGLIGTLPNVLLVGPAVKATNFQEFLAEAHQRSATPNPMAYGSGGNGSSLHLCGEYFRHLTGINALHIPFKGNAPALVALLGGETAFQFDNITTAIPQIRAGKVRALGVTGARRSSVLPDVPTMAELGYKDFVLGSWNGLSAPAGTPADIVDAVAKALTRALADPPVAAQLTQYGMQLPDFPPSGYRAFVESEIKRWGSLVRMTGAKLD